MKKKLALSVLSPSNRGTEALNVVAKALMRQDFEDFEWIIGSPQKPLGIFLEHRWIKDPPKREGDYWCLNRAYNKLISEARGELIVSIQDNTSFDPDALSKFWFHYKNNPLAVVSGIGDKYDDDTFLNKTWQDPRKRSDIGSFYEVNFADIEFNFCAVPRKAFYDIGGFDEELDRIGYGMDAYGVLERLSHQDSYKFYLDQTNESFSIEHDRYGGWEKNNAIHGGYQKRREQLIETNQWPVLNYLPLV